MRRETVGTLLVLSAAAGFGTLPIFGTWSTDAGLNNTTMLTYRFLLASVLLLLVPGMLAQFRSLDRQGFIVSFTLGVLYAVFSGLYFWGLLYVPAGVAAIVFYTYPIFVFVLSMATLGEAVSRRKLLALVLALSGIALIVGGGVGSVDVRGVVLVLLAALGLGIYMTASRAALGRIDADVFTTAVLIVTTIAFLAFGVGTDRLFVPQAFDQWAIIVGIGVVGTAVPLFLFLSGLSRIEASRASIVSTVEPIVAVFLGIALLGETLTGRTIMGGVLVVIAVTVIQTASNRDEVAEPR